MTELERVKEFMETLEFHGYIDHYPTKFDSLIEEYYPLKQGQTLPLDSVVVPKGTLSNLDDAIKKAKPNMDKIKDVDKHLDSIR